VSVRLIHGSLHKAKSLAGVLFLVAGLVSAVAGADNIRFIDVAQFTDQGKRHPTAEAHVTGRRGEQYELTQFVSIVDRATNLNSGKLMLRRASSGKWIPTKVQFTAQENSLAGGSPLGAVVASKPSQFVVTLSEDGMVRGTEIGASDNLSALGSGLQGSMKWNGSQTLDLRTGADDWHFEGSMEARDTRRRGGRLSIAIQLVPFKGSLSAGDHATRAIKLTGTIDQSPEVVSAVPADSSRALLIGTTAVRSSVGAAVLRYNDRGVLTVQLVNHTGVDLTDLNADLKTADGKEGIVSARALSGASRIGAGEQYELKYGLATDFSVPPNNLNLMVTVTYHNAVLAQKNIAVPTDAFCRETQLHAANLASRRLRAAGKYFGYGNTKYGDPEPELSAAARGGDDLAAMWEAVFLSQGAAGYPMDEEKAFQIAKRALPRVEAAARGGDVEALYLLFYACQIGAEGDDARDAADSLLERAAATGFPPARFDYARLLGIHHDYARATKELQDAYGAGLKKASVLIGKMYERGEGVERDPAAAVKWYREGSEFGDPEALLSLANVLSKGFGDTPPDAVKAKELASEAAELRYSPADVYLGKAYASGRQGLRQDPETAMAAFKAAADLGDRQGMLAIGELDLGGTPGFEPDDRMAVYWIRRAAERGSPRAMIDLAELEKDGKLVEKDVIAARYWYNQAVLNGYAAAENKGLAAQQEAFLDFWRYADFSPSYVVVNEYGNQVGDSGDGFLNGVLTGTFAAMTSYYSSQQQMIDGLELMVKKNGKRIYGGTVSSNFTSRLQLRAGETVSIRSYGVISTGMMSGAADADGLGTQWPQYRIVPYIPCSAVMGKIGDGPWQFVGKHAQLIAEKDGPLALALNGIDYRNYKGYFDLVVEVADKN
jgi:TPR repeat protein